MDMSISRAINTERLYTLASQLIFMLGFPNINQEKAQNSLQGLDVTISFIGSFTQELRKRLRERSN